MEEKKSCQNCKYYVPYYIKRGSKFWKTDLGHCGYPKRDLPPELCENWDACYIANIEESQSIKEQLRTITNQLQEVIRLMEYND